MKKIITLILGVLMCASVVYADDIPAGTKLYLEPNSNWVDANARFAAYFYGDGDTWVDMTAVAGTNLYEVVTPAGTWTNVIFCRMNPSQLGNNWDNRWNQTRDLTYDGTNNSYTIKDGVWTENGDGDAGIWGLPPTKEITFNVTVPAKTPAVWITGSFNNSWADSFVPMIEGSNPNEFYYTTDIYITDLIVEYKYYSAATGWNNVENHENGDPRLNSVDNRSFDFSSALSTNDEVPSWNTMLTDVTFTASFDDGVIVPSQLYIGGDFDFNGGWVYRTMTKNETDPVTFSYAVDCISRGMEYKYLYNELDPASYENLGGNRTAASSSMNDIILGWSKNPATSLASPRSIGFVIGKTAAIEVQFEGTATIEIYSTLGALVEKTIATNQFEKTGLKAGLYLVKLNGNTHKVFVK